MERTTPTNQESSEEKLKFSVDRILNGQISKRKADSDNQATLTAKCLKPAGRQKPFFLIFFGRIDNVFPMP